jgi:hypothetical protein
VGNLFRDNNPEQPVLNTAQMVLPVASPAGEEEVDLAASLDCSVE